MGLRKITERILNFKDGQDLRRMDFIPSVLRYGVKVNVEITKLLDPKKSIYT